MRAGLRAALLTSAALLAPLAALPAEAQTIPIVADGEQPQNLLLEAEVLNYDYENEVVTATGDVIVYYGAYTLTTDRLIYNRRTGKVLAVGNVEITQPDGSVIVAERADVSETLSTGFVEALSLRTAENTRFAASEAERVDEDTTVLVRGVYTACEPCKANPEKRPTWQIKARRIVYDQERELVYYRDARLELFGLPIAYFPAFAHSTAEKKRQTGFLMPTIGFAEDLGVGVTTPFYWNIAPNMDATFRPTYYTRQGLLADGEFRHRLMNGAYSIRAAGIIQQEPDAFAEGTPDANSLIDASLTNRGYVETHGRFRINSRWNWGWDGYLLSDRRFLPTYGYVGANEADVTSEVFLTGLGVRNFFDARMQHFEPLTKDITDSAIPDIHPLVDYHAVIDDPIAGGELRFDANMRTLTRQSENVTCVRGGVPTGFDGTVLPGSCKGTASILGFAGQSTRITGKLDWRRQFVTTWGQLITPFASARGDAYWLDLDRNDHVGPNFPVGDHYYARFMPAVGVDTQLPLVSDLGWATQTLTPRLQIVARPDEGYIGRLPNEDAQSLVFDTTTLFEVDKFSGFDRAEGGVRANAGLTYALTADELTAELMIGQSYHLAGLNSFSKQDTLRVGADSGLETRVSDIVGSAAVGFRNIAVEGRVRLDEESLDAKRIEVGASYSGERVSGTLTYVNLAERPGLGITDERQQVTASARLNLTDRWTLTGRGVFDVDDDYFRSAQAGIGWADECFEINLGYSGTYNINRAVAPRHRVSLSVNLRTIGGATAEKLLNTTGEDASLFDFGDEGGGATPFKFTVTPGF